MTPVLKVAVCFALAIGAADALAEQPCGRVAADHSRSGRERSRPTQRAGFRATLRPR